MKASHAKTVWQRLNFFFFLILIFFCHFKPFFFIFLFEQTIQQQKNKQSTKKNQSTALKTRTREWVRRIFLAKSLIGRLSKYFLPGLIIFVVMDSDWWSILLLLFIVVSSWLVGSVGWLNSYVGIGSTSIY